MKTNMFTIDAKQQKSEAISRMEYLQLRPAIISCFKDRETVLVSNEYGYEPLPKRIKEVVKGLEHSMGCLVYHVIKTELDNDEGTVKYSLLFVPLEINEWLEDRENMKHGRVCSFVFDEVSNYSCFGAIAIYPVDGSLQRNNIGHDFEADWQDRINAWRKDRYGKVKDAMRTAGYNYDWQHSDDYTLCFVTDLGQSIQFDNWMDVEDWINTVVFDDPNTNQRIQNILHPDRQLDDDLEI